MLAPGTKLGCYEVLSPLGAGGMGEVYRARDSKLNREVALKVLPEAVAGDAERMLRFEREAQVLASLNHPNIAAIYGLEDTGSIRALVMELVEGPTLAERIAQGPLPLDEALGIAQDIAEGLEYAHEKGIVHRDLKPANVKITREGGAKILDFGLAKALDPLGASASSSAAGSAPLQNSPTITMAGAATQAGMILGTAAYMSPEQAKGKPVDRRADIWAFGCILYETLAGKATFEGETTSDVLAAVIRADPDWKTLPTGTPARIRELAQRCLKKDPKQRLQAIGDARIMIEEVLSGGTGILPMEGLGQDAHAATGAAPPRAAVWLAAAVITLLIGIGIGWWADARHAPTITKWSGRRLGGPSTAMDPRISPDGHTIAFQAMVDGLTQVAVMDVESNDWTVLTKNRSRGYVTELNWSPDGSQIYFDRELSVPNGIYTVSRFGGDEHVVLEDAFFPEVLPDGSLLLSRVNKNRNTQVYHYWPEGGRLEPLDAVFAGTTDLALPLRVFRDGKEAVFYGETMEQVGSDSTPYLFILNIATGKAERFAPGIQVRIISSLSLFPIAISSDDQSVLLGTMAGDLFQLLSIPRHGTPQARTLFSLTMPVNFIDVDRAGNVYLDQLERPSEVLRISEAGGTAELLAGPQTATKGEYQALQLPDGRAVLASIVGGLSRLVAAKPGGEPAPFIETREETWLPACLLGAGEIAFVLGPAGQQIVAVATIADGRIVRRLEEINANQIQDLAASPDGKTLYYVASSSIWAVSAQGGTPRRITSGDSVAPDPNGKDLVIQLNEKEGVRLMRVTANGATKLPITSDGGLRVTTVALNPNAIGKDGRIALSLAVPDSWFYGMGFLDPRTGKLQRVPSNFVGDHLAPGWLPDGSLLFTGWPMHSKLWRFHPEAP